MEKAVQMIKRCFYILLLALLLQSNSKSVCAFDDFFAVEDVIEREDYYIPTSSTNTPKDIETICVLPDLETQAIDIKQAINIALCRNPETKISWLSIKQKEASYGMAKSSYLPDASLSNTNSYGWSSPGSTESKSESIQASFDWLLYDFGKRKAETNQAYYNLLQSAHNHNDVIEEFIYNTIETYYNLFSSKEAVKASIRSEESYKVAYDIAKEKYKLGVVALADMLKAETSYSQSILARQKAENTEAIYKGQFLKTLNIPQGTEFKIASPSLVFGKDDILKSKIDKLVEKSIQNRSDIKALEAQRLATKASENATRKERMPSVSFYGSAGYNRSFSSTTDDWSNGRSGSVGVKVSVPLFTGFSQTYSEKRAKYALESAEHEEQKLKNDAAFEVWQSYQELKTAKITFETSEQLLKSSLENKNVALGMYKAGKGSMLEVLEAEADYADAENENISSRYNILIAEASLLKALGELYQDILRKDQPIIK